MVFFLLRGMFGLDGSALVTGTIASDATYTESVDIESRIETLVILQISMEMVT